MPGSSPVGLDEKASAREHACGFRGGAEVAEAGTSDHAPHRAAERQPYRGSEACGPATGDSTGDKLPVNSLVHARCHPAGTDPVEDQTNTHGDAPDAAPPLGRGASPGEVRDFGSNEDAAFKESGGLAACALSPAPSSDLVDQTSGNSYSGSPFGETETQEMADSDQDHSGNGFVSKTDRVTHNQATPPPHKEEELPVATPPALQYPVPITKYPPWLASLLKCSTRNGRGKNLGAVPYLREPTEPAPGSLPNQDGKHGPPDDYPNRLGRKSCGHCRQNRLKFGGRVHSCKCRVASHASCAMLQRSATGKCPLCQGEVDFALVVKTVAKGDLGSLNDRVQSLVNSLMEHPDWESLASERDSLLAGSSVPGKARAMKHGVGNYFSPLGKGKAVSRLRSLDLRRPHKIRYRDWPSRIRNYLHPKDPRSPSNKVLRNMEKRRAWYNRERISHDLDLLDKLKEKILEIRWVTRGICYRSVLVERKKVRGINIGRVGKPAPAPSSRSITRAKERLSEARASAEDPLDAPVAPAAPAKVTASSQTDPPLRVVETNMARVRVRLRKARASAEVPSNAPVPPTPPAKAIVRKRVVGIKINRVGSDKFAPVPDLGKIGSVKPIPASRSIKRAKERLRKARASAEIPADVRVPPLDPPVNPVQSGGSPTASGGAATSQMDPPPPKKPRRGEPLPKVNPDEESESPPDLMVEARPDPVAHAVYFSPTEPYTLTFYWVNSADTCIRGSLLEEVGVGPAGPTHQPFTNAGWYQIRIGPAVNTDGSHRTQAVIKLPKTWVRVLEEDSDQLNVINVLLSLCSCSSEVAKPGNGWRGGIKTETGICVTFDDNFLLTPEQRTLQVPYQSNQPEARVPVQLVREYWWSP